MDSLVSLRNISVHFRKSGWFLKKGIVKAVDGVSLDIKPGETLALIGESGSGKTTLGKVSLKLIDPVQGQIIFEDHDITNLRRSELLWFRQKAQMVFQDPFSSLDPLMHVSQIVEEALILQKDITQDQRRETVLKTLEDVRLVPVEEFIDKYPHKLSGGQKQRVGIARALITRPKYIVADEPVSMIDASSRAEILSLMGELQRKYGISFLYITHDIATAKHFSDQIAVMKEGKIVEIGKSTDVISNPQHPYTKTLISAVPTPDPKNRFSERRIDSDI